MSIDEAKSCIGTIEMLQRLAYNIHGVMDVIDADNCKKIIKMLEQEPNYNSIKTELEPCDDAICRRDLREPRFIIAENDYQKGWNDALDSVYENAPSVQPQPKIGHWEWVQYDGNPNIGNWNCSECHIIGISYFDYCPYCGAKMSEIPTGEEGSEE